MVSLSARPAEPSDAARCQQLAAEYAEATWVELEEAGFRVRHPSSGSSDEGPVFDTYERIVLVSRDGSLAGNVCLDRGGATQARLHRLWVRPAHRRAGVGRRLVEESVEWARSIGAESIWLDVLRIRHAARCLYESTGFVVLKDDPQSALVEYVLDLA